jgi:hypothetical protein
MTKIRFTLGAFALSTLVLTGAPALAGDGNDQSSSQRGRPDGRYLSSQSWQPSVMDARAQIRPSFRMEDRTTGNVNNN